MSTLVWQQLAKASFAVVSYVTPAGEPRSSGVLYTMVGRTMYVAVANDSWKAKHIAANGTVAVTVPVRRGGLLALMFPIPPATISFHGTATVRPATFLGSSSVPPNLARLLPPERRDACTIIQIEPVGQFLTYGIGVSLAQMRLPAVARGHVPVSS
jgi:hypothetical protein